MPATSITIDLWTDMGCPWCYVGKARLAKAIKACGHTDRIELVLHSFELDPNASTKPETIAELIGKKYNATPEQFAAMEKRVADLAIAEGLPFSSNRLSANTFDIHRIMHLAKTFGVSVEVFDNLQREYFAGESSPYENETLIRICVAAGMPEDDVLAVLHSDRFADTVRLDEEYGRELGITGVPFAVFDKKYGASGALSVDDYASAIATVVSERSNA
ncbi:MAG: DsbA family oxidoreductase [Actinobacteria bacterium]|nr:DsbA family oxidoreductase [Actinomycetota bacterium]